MVRGMDLFREHFAGFEDRYVLIGGAACDLAMQDAGLDFRATKDLDIVLCVEALDAEFVEAFWAFVKRGGYKQQRAGGFQRPWFPVNWIEEFRAGFPVALIMETNLPRLDRHGIWLRYNVFHFV